MLSEREREGSRRESACRWGAGVKGFAMLRDMRQDLGFLALITVLTAVVLYYGLADAEPLPGIALFESCALRCESRFMGAVVIDRGSGWECLCDPEPES
jgi:hypothetical protein